MANESPVPSYGGVMIPYVQPLGSGVTCRRLRQLQKAKRLPIDANCLSDGRARSETVLEQLGGGCTAARFARMGKDESKKHQEWKERVGYNSGWMVEIIVSSFKRLLGEALSGGEARVHHDRGGRQDGSTPQDPDRHEQGRMVRRGPRRAAGATRTPPRAVRGPHGGRTVHAALGREL